MHIIPSSSAPDEEIDADAYFDALAEKGEDGFQKLLASLSPHLLSPFQVFESSWQSGETFVTSYLVLPNDPNVRTFFFSRKP